VQDALLLPSFSFLSFYKMEYYASSEKQPYVKVEHTVSVMFDIPKGTKLREYQGDGYEQCMPGSWYIKYGLFHYYDNDGIYKNITGYLDDHNYIGDHICDNDFKRHEPGTEKAYGIEQATDCICGNNTTDGEDCPFLNCELCKRMYCLDCSGPDGICAECDGTVEYVPVAPKKPRKVRSDKGKKRGPRNK
jgi:hypothetical protein